MGDREAGSEREVPLSLSDDVSIGYFDHDADIGVVGRGETIEAAFIAVARAMFWTMADLDALSTGVQVEVSFIEPDPEIALVRWLNALLAEAHIGSLALGRFQLTRDGDSWHGRAWGERWRPDIVRGTEVKGATLTMLSVRYDAGQWEARCVVDV